MKTFGKRWLSMLLAVIMVAGMIPAGVFTFEAKAAGTDSSGNTIWYWEDSTLYIKDGKITNAQLYLAFEEKLGSPYEISSHTYTTYEGWTKVTKACATTGVQDFQYGGSKVSNYVIGGTSVKSGDTSNATLDHDSTITVYRCTGYSCTTGSHSLKYDSGTDITIKHYYEPTVTVTGKDGVTATGVPSTFVKGEDVTFNLTGVGEAGWVAKIGDQTYTLNTTGATEVTAKGQTAATISVVLEKAPTYPITVNVVNGDWGEAEVKAPQGIAGAEIGLTITPKATDSATYSYTVSVNEHGTWDASTGKITVKGTGDVVVTVTFSKSELEVNTNPTLEINGYSSDTKFADIKKNILNAVLKNGYTNIEDYTLYIWLNNPVGTEVGGVQIGFNTGYFNWDDTETSWNHLVSDNSAIKLNASRFPDDNFGTDGKADLKVKIVDKQQGRTVEATIEVTEWRKPATITPGSIGSATFDNLGGFLAGIKDNMTVVDRNNNNIDKSNVTVSDPVKNADGTYTVTAQVTTAGATWLPSEVVTMGPYTFKYTQYEVIFVDHEGNEIHRYWLDNESTPSYNGTTDMEAYYNAKDTVEWDWTFTGWEPDYSALNGASVTYTATYTQEKQKYTITWVNGDGTTYSYNVPYGTTAEELEAMAPTASKTSTAQYHFTNGTWGTIATVTGDATYTATFTEELRSYTITWVNGDETTTTTVAYGETPVAPTASKTSTAQYHFTNGTWGEIATVTGDATYTATFTEELRSYTITWVNGDETTTTTVAYGETPVAPTPYKAPTAEVEVWEFLGWTPAIVKVEGEATYTAKFQNAAYVAEVNGVKYTSIQAAVEAANSGDTVIVTKDHAMDITKGVINSDGYYTLVNVTGKAITIDLNGKKITVDGANLPTVKASMLLAVFAVDTNGKLTLKDSAGNGSVKMTANGKKMYSIITSYADSSWLYVESGSYILDTGAAYSLIYANAANQAFISGGYFEMGNAHEKTDASNGKPYPWIFNGPGNGGDYFIVSGGTYNVHPQNSWDEITIVNHYSAVENADGTWTVKEDPKYTVTWMNGNTVVGSYTNYAGEAVVIPTLGTPTKTGYTFAGWDAEAPATMPEGNVTINATYTINQYTITFVDYNDEEIATLTQDYGTAVTAPADPTRVGHTFTGWNAVVPATMPAENMTIKAVYDINVYTITWVVDGVETTETYTYGSVPSFKGSTDKAADAQYTYTFTDWDKEIVAATEDATYTAQYSKTVNKYTVTWIVDGKTTTETYEYGETPSFKGSTDKATANYIKYTFTGWDVTPVAVTGNVTYTAQYSAELLASNGTVKINGYYESRQDQVIFDTLKADVLKAAGITGSASNYTVKVNLRGNYYDLDKMTGIANILNWETFFLAVEVPESGRQFQITDKTTGVSKTVTMAITDSREYAPIYNVVIDGVQIIDKDHNPSDYLNEWLKQVNPKDLTVTCEMTQGTWPPAEPGVTYEYKYTVTYADDATYKGTTVTLTVNMQSLLHNCTVVPDSTLTAGGNLTVNGSTDNKTVAGNATVSITVVPNSDKIVETIYVYENGTLIATYTTDKITYSNQSATVSFKTDGTEIADVYTVGVEYSDKYLNLKADQTIVYCVDDKDHTYDLQKLVFDAIYGGSCVSMTKDNVKLEFKYGHVVVDLWADVSKDPAINLNGISHKFGESGSETIRLTYTDPNGKYGSFDQQIALNVFDSCYNVTVGVETITNGANATIKTQFSEDARKYLGVNYFKQGTSLTVTLTPDGAFLDTLKQMYNGTYADAMAYIKSVTVYDKNGNVVTTAITRDQGKLSLEGIFDGVNPMLYNAAVTFDLAADGAYKIVVEYGILELDAKNSGFQMEMYQGGKGYAAKVPSAQDLINAILGETEAAAFLATYGGAFTVDFSTSLIDYSWTAVSDEALLALNDGTEIKIRITWKPADGDKTYYPVADTANVTLVDLRTPTSVQGEVPTTPVEYVEESQLIANMKEAMGLGILANGALIDVEYAVNYTIEVLENGNFATVIVTYHGSENYKPTTKTFENVPVADIPDNATIKVTIQNASDVITNNAGTIMGLDPATGIYTVIGNGTYNFKFTPVSGKAIESVTVNGVKVDITYASGVVTFSMLLTEKEHYEVVVETVDSIFVLEDERVYDFATGVMDPDNSDIVDSVTKYPTDIDFEEVVLEYLAREEGKVTITLPDIDLGFTVIELGTFDVDLGELWLSPDTDIEMVSEDQLDKILEDLVDDVISKVSNGELAANNALEYVQNYIKALPLGIHAFGANGDGSIETIRFSYADDKYTLAEVVTDVTIHDYRTATEIKANDCTVTYGYSLEQLLAAAGAGVFANDALVSGLKIETNDLYKHAGTQTITLYFAGDLNYQPCEITINVTVNKASVDIDYDSQFITYGDTYNFGISIAPITLPDGTDCDPEMIEFLIGLDMRTLLDFSDNQDIVGLGDSVAYIQLRLPKSIRELPLVGQYLQGEFTLGEFTKLINDLSDTLGIDEGSMEILNQVVEAITGITDNMEIKIIVKDEEFHPTNIGVYIAGAVTIDADYETAYTADYLIIAPKINEVELDWNAPINDYLTTLPAWNAMNKGAHIVGEPVDGFTVKYLVLGINSDTSEFLTTDIYGNIKANIWVNPEEISNNGAYVQIAYGVLWGNELYYSVPIVRAFAIVPEVVDVELKDNNGNTTNDMTVDFTNKGQGFDVYVDGIPVTDSEWLDVYYIGVQSNGKLYNSTERPVHAGIYTAIAVYAEFNNGGKLSIVELEQIVNAIKDGVSIEKSDLEALFNTVVEDLDGLVRFGANVGVLVILPAESDVTVQDKIEIYDPENSYDPKDQVVAGSTADGTLTPDTTIITAGIGTTGIYSENGWNMISGTVNVDFPRWMDELIAEYAPSIVDGISIADFKQKIADKLPAILEALEAEGVEGELLNAVSDAVNNVVTALDKMPDNVTLSFKDDVQISKVGAYVVIAVVTDSDHYPSVDAGLLVITPDITEVELKWNYEDANGIFTRDTLDAIDYDLWAKAFANGTLDETATSQITYQFVGFNADGDLVVYTKGDDIPNGAYVELAYIEFTFDNELYMSNLLARPVVIIPSNCKVEVENVETEFDNTAKDVVVNIFDLNGNAIDITTGELSFIYTGIQTNGKTYLSTEAPVHAGIYEVVVTFIAYDENGDMRYYGVGAATIVIKMTQSSIDVTGGNHKYDGNGHTVTVTPGSTVSGLKPDFILISGTVGLNSKLDTLGVDAFYGNVNIDLPKWLDEVLASTEAFKEGISPAYLIDLINSYRDEIVGAMPEFAVDKVNEYIDELIALLNKMPADVTITFADNVAYTKPGYYFFYGIVADSDHYPSTDTGLLVIEKIELDFDLKDTETVYNGEEQFVNIFNPMGTDYISLIYDIKGGVLNLVADEDINVIIDLIEEQLGKELPDGIKTTVTVTEIVAAVNKILAKIETVEGLPAEAVEALEWLQDKLSKLPVDVVIVLNGELPVNAGKYEIFAFTYSEIYKSEISHGTLIINPAKVTIIVDDETIHIGDALPEGSFTIKIVEGFIDTSILNATIKFINANTNVAGEYTITVVYTIGDNYEVTVVAGTLTVEDHVAGEVVVENNKAPGCTTEGSYDNVVYCTVCGKELSRETIIVDALGHTAGEVVVENNVAPDCENTGSYDNVVYCTVCGAELSRETVTVDALGHTAGSVVVENSVASDCTTEGTYDNVVYCTVCGKELSRVTITVDALGHTAGETRVENNKAPTCTATGSYENVVYCLVCGEAISRETVTVPALGHTAGATVVENYVAPTCTATGSYDNVVYCTVCDAELSRTAVVVSKLGHTAGSAVVENYVDATCTEPGSYDNVVYCTVCGAELSRETITVTAPGHNYTTAVTAPTCTEKGYTTYTCSVCGDSYTADEVAALGHTEGNAVTENRVEPTYEAAGHYDSVVYCTVCGAEIRRETIEIPKLLGIKDVVVNGEYIYNGTEQTVDITVNMMDGTVLSSDNYTITGNVATNAGTYTITVTGIGEYAGVSGSATWTIAKKSVTITANDKSMVAGNTVPTLDAIVEGLVGSDTLNYTVATDANGKTAGTYAITVTLNADNANYEVTLVNGTLTVEAAMIRVYAANNAKVKYFTSLNEALQYAASQNDYVPVTILGNLVIDETIVFNDSSANTIELQGGQTGGRTFTLTSNFDGPMFKIESGRLNIKNIKIDAYGDAFYVTGGALSLNYHSKNSQFIEVTSRTGNCIYIRGGSVAVNGAKLTSLGEYPAIQGNGNFAGNVTITKWNIGDGTYPEISAPNSDMAIYWPGNGKLTIEGGTIIGDTAIYAKSGTITINGGEIIANGAKVDFAHSSNGAIATGDALVIEACKDAAYEIPVVYINGGKFTSANGKAVGYYTCDGTKLADENFITGGSFSSDVQDLCEIGYGAEPQADGTYTVKSMIIITVDNKTMVAGNALPEFTYTVNKFNWDVNNSLINVTMSTVIDGTGLGDFEITGTAQAIDGYYVVVVPGTLTIEGCIVKVDDVAYGSWEMALPNIKGDSKIVLYANVVNNGSFSESEQYKTLTLDLNGYNFKTATIGLSGHGTLHITDSASGGSVTVTNYTALYTNGYLNVDSDVDFNSKLQIGYHTAEQPSTGCLLIDGVKWFGRGHFEQADGIFGMTGGGYVTIKNKFADITFESGTFTLNESVTMIGEKITVAKDATVVVSAEKTLTLPENTAMVVNGTLTVNGAVELKAGATLQAVAGLNVVTSVANSCVYYANGVYSVAAHTVVTDAAVAPDCTNTGLTEGSHCDNCGEVLVAQQTVDALGHTAGNVVVENKNPATCTDDGSHDEVVYCTVCGEELSRTTVVDTAPGHNYESVVTPPTMDEQGYTTHTCSVCGDSYVDSYTDSLYYALTVDGVKYKSWADAMASIKKNSQIKLYDDVEFGIDENGKKVEQKFLSNGGDIVIDLNGYELTFHHTVVVQFSTTLTITDTSTTPGTFKTTSDSYPFVINGKSSVNITNGVGFDGIVQLQNLHSGNTAYFRINGENIIGTDASLFVTEGSTVRMTLRNNYMTLGLSSGALALTDDLATLAGQSITIASGTTFTIRENVTLTLNPATTIVVNGTVDGKGTIAVGTQAHLDLVLDKTEIKNIEILAGIAIDSYTLERADVFYTGAENLIGTGVSITAGTFDYDVYAKCVVGYATLNNGNDTWTVVEAVAQNVTTGKYYATADEALTSAKTGETVKLLADTTINSVIIGYSEPVKITLDLNGKTLTAKDKAITTNRPGTVLTLINGTLAGNSTGGTLKIGNGSKVVLGNGITITSGGQADAIQIGTGTLEVVEGATVTVEGGINCLETEGETINTITITGGTFTGKIVINDQSTCTITGGTFTQDVNEWCAPGYYAKDNGDGTWTVKYGTVKNENTGVIYGTLTDAVANADAGDTIVFIADITEDATISNSVTIDGKNFKYTGNISVSGTSTAITIKNINFVDGTGYAVTTNRIKSVTIENCTVTNYGLGFLYANKSTPTVVVKDVTVENATLGINWVYGTTATLENVVMKDVAYGLQIHNYASKTINLKNCDITSIVIYERDGSSGVQTFNFEGDNTVDTLSASQYAKYVLAETSATLTAPEKNAEGVKYEVTTSVDGYKVVYANGVYSLVKCDYVAEINGVKYESLQEAIETAQDEDVIVVLKDIDLAKTELQLLDNRYDTYFLVAGKTITIDLNGKTISGEYTGTNIMLVGVFSTNNGGHLTLTGNGTIDVTATNKVYSLFSNYNPGCSITIENGTYKLDKASDCLIHTAPSAHEGDGTEGVIVNGGSFYLGNVGTGTNGMPWIFNANGSGELHVWVTGGTFNADVYHQHYAWEVQYPDNKSAIVNNGDGTWTVADAVAYIGRNLDGYTRKTGYTTFAAALEAAAEGETITIIADLTIDVNIDKNVTVLKYDKNVTVTGTLSAGTYDWDVESYCNANTHRVINNDNNTWTVIKKWSIEVSRISYANSLAIDFAFRYDNEKSWNGCYAIVTQVLADGTKREVTVTTKDWKGTKIDGVNYLLVRYTGIAAKEMCDNIYVTIYNADGVALSTTWEDSLRAQSVRNYNGSTDDELNRALIKAMLNYGAEAQKYFEYNINDLANVGFDATVNVSVENKQVVSGTTKYFRGSRAVYDNNILFQFQFNFGTLSLSDNAKAVISYTDYLGNEVKYEIMLAEVEKTGSAYLVSVDKLVAADCRTIVQVSIVDNNETLVTVEDSLASNAARISAGNKQSASLCLSMINYGDAAKAYLLAKQTESQKG